jgi:hypothetical protein
MLGDGDLEGMWKEAFIAWLQILPSTHPDSLRKTMKKTCHDIGLDLNPEHYNTKHSANHSAVTVGEIIN